MARWFEFGLADALGMRPEVERCVECDRVLEEDETVPLGARAGRHDVLAATCRRRLSRCVLSLAALKLLRAYRRLDIEAHRRPAPAAAVEAEVELALRRFIRNVLEREPRSLAFLDEVRARRPLVGVMVRSADAGAVHSS